MDALPVDIVREIFSFLPAKQTKSVFRLGSKTLFVWIPLFLVCKKWEKAATLALDPSYNHNRY
jgi:hypothetical protein